MTRTLRELMAARFRIGGSVGQIALMHRLFADEKSWPGEEGYLYALNDGMLLPGPEARQLATDASWRQHGIRGGALPAPDFRALDPFAIALAVGGSDCAHPVQGAHPLCNPQLRGGQPGAARPAKWRLTFGANRLKSAQKLDPGPSGDCGGRRDVGSP